MKNSKTNLILIISIILSIISIVLLFYFLNVIKNKNRHISAVSSTLEQKILDKQNISNLEKKMSELSDTNKKILSYLVDTSKIDTFVVYLENLGIENNVTLSVKSVEISKNEKNKILVTLSMKGDFSNLTKVIGLLENSPFSVNIVSSYLNKIIVNTTEVTDTPKNKSKDTVSVVNPSWQSDITFNVLSL